MKTIKEYIMVPTGPIKFIELQRAEAGAKNYLEDMTRGIVISGLWNGTTLHGYFGSQSQFIFEKIKSFRVPSEIIKFENKSRNTIENVFYGCKFLTDERAESLIVVTDEDHRKRFELLFGVAKDDKLIPKSFNINFYSEGIDKAYSFTKAKMAYLKDYLKTFNGIKVD